MIKNYNYNDYKTVIVLSSKLEPKVAMNVVGHLSISIGAYTDNKLLMGQTEITDRDGNIHIGISRYPVIATKVKPGKLQNLVQIIKENSELLVIDYPEEMLTTGHDSELVEAIEKKTNSDINYLGIAVFGKTDVVNQFTGKFTLWS